MGKGQEHSRYLWPMGRVSLNGVWIIHVVIAITGLLGLAWKGIRFLGTLAPVPLLEMGLLVAVGLSNWLLLAYVLLSWKTQDEKRRRGARQMALATVTISTTMLLLLFLGAFRYDLPSPAGGTTPSLTIAVARLETGGGSGAGEASAYISRVLRREIGRSPDLNVRVVAAPAATSGALAEQVARDSGADWIIWGSLPAEAPGFFAPQLSLISERAFQPVWHHEEITGRDLGLYRLQARGHSSFADYIIGLIYLHETDYAPAEDRFYQVVAFTEGDAAPERPAALSYLALGCIASARGENDIAREEFLAARQCESTGGAAVIALRAIGYTEEGSPIGSPEGNQKAALPAASAVAAQAVLSAAPTSRPTAVPSSTSAATATPLPAPIETAVPPTPTDTATIIPPTAVVVLATATPPLPAQPMATATPSPDVATTTPKLVKVTGKLDALRREGEFAWSAVALDCLNAQGQSVGHIGLTGVEEFYPLPAETAQVKLWIGDALGGAEWWKHWNTEAASAAGSQISLQISSIDDKDKEDCDCEIRF